MDDLDLTRDYPEIFRARARYKRANAAALMEGATRGDPSYPDLHQEAAMAIAEARGLELAADEIEAES